MMRKILFVDNNSDKTQEFKNTLRSMSREWEIETVVNGSEALNFMSNSSFDAVVSDIMIKGMGGIEFLDTVNDRYPEIVRIIHSAFTDPEMVLKSKNTVHLFLMKPCSAETMKNTIERTCTLRDLLRDRELKKIIAGISTLPSLPDLYNQIVAEMHSSEPSLKKVGHLVSQDVSMSAKILQLINSALFGLSQKIVDPQQAVVYVGIETLKALVLSFHVFSSFEEDAESCGFSISKMWGHSMMTSRLAKNIARVEKADSKVMETAMIAGMLHDLGKLVLIKVPEKYREVMSLIETTGSGFSDVEYAVMETSHSELGAYLLGLWGLPSNVVETVAFHHKPSKLLDNMFVLQKESSNGELNKTKTENDDSSSQSAEKYSSEFIILTAVHIANALIMQGDCSSETTSFPYIDMSYLKRLGLKDKLPEWIETYNDTKQLFDKDYR